MTLATLHQKPGSADWFINTDLQDKSYSKKEIVRPKKCDWELIETLAGTTHNWSEDI